MAARTPEWDTSVAGAYHSTMRTTLWPLLTALLLVFALPSGQASPANEGLVVYLVRHAEKAEGSGDVALTTAGAVRAEALAGVLADVRLVGVHSTDTTRTRSTAAPTARQHDLTVALYDHRDRQGLVKRLVEQGGHHLVVGHSNTVPPLVEALGGQPGSEIRHDEYDRLYVVFRRGEDSQSSLLRYGSPKNSQP